MKKSFKRGITSKTRDQIDGLLFVAVPIIGLTLFIGIPLVFSLVLSFGKLTTFEITDITFVGFENYIRIFTNDRTYFLSIMWSFIFAIFASLLQTAFSLLIAYLLSKIKSGQTAIRIILFIPYVCSVVAISYVWNLLLDKNYGVFNDILVRFGASTIDFLNDDRFSMIMMIIMAVWSGLGYGTILYSAALGGIDKSLYESADVMGASETQKFFRITWQCITPTTFYLLVMGMISNLQAFANFQIMKPSFNGEQIETMVYHVWWAAFEKTDSYGLGYASALGWITGIIIIIFSIVMIRLQKKWVHYEN